MRRKQLPPFGANHRHDTPSLAVHWRRVQAVHPTLPLTVSLPVKRFIWTHTVVNSLAAQQTQCIICCWYEQRDCSR